jgi:hypothetical protein
MNAALALLVSFVLVVPTGTSRVINFDSLQPGSSPPGWSVSMTNPGAAPHWVIVKDGTAPTPPYVLAQTSTDSSRNRLPLLTFDGLRAHDADVSVRVKPVSGKIEAAGGVVFRYVDQKNYYLAQANALDNEVALYKVENGVSTPLGSGVKHPIPINGWSILKVVVRGDRFQVYLNHRRILRGQDDTFTGAGKVGLWTHADSVTYFDDFRVDPK